VQNWFGAAAELGAPVVPTALAKPRAASADLTPSPDAPPAPAAAVAAAAAAPSGGGVDPASLVGRRLRVWWPEERAFFEAAVASYDAASGRHAVRYDDGDEEAVRLADERVEWLPDAPKRCETRTWPLLSQEQ
jgi:DNA mismatch repair protein MSH6